MTERTIPVTILELYVAELRSSAKSAERFFGAPTAIPLTRVADEVQALIDNPAYRWVAVAEAARILRVSEETIRRKCRTSTAEFRFEQQDGGHYRIWLADLGLLQAA